MVVSEPGLLWGYYIRWCMERVEDEHVKDAGRVRVSLLSTAENLKSIGHICDMERGVSHHQAITRLLTMYRSATDGKHMTSVMFEEQVTITKFSFPHTCILYQSACIIIHVHVRTSEFSACSSVFSVYLSILSEFSIL